jgi:hypothetical protein
LFDATEEAFDEGTVLVLMPIKRTQLHAVGLGWDHRFGAAACDGDDQRIGIEGRVCDHGAGGDAFDRGLRSRRRGSPANHEKAKRMAATLPVRCRYRSTFLWLAAAEERTRTWSSRGGCVFVCISMGDKS